MNWNNWRSVLVVTCGIVLAILLIVAAAALHDARQWNRTELDAEVEMGFYWACMDGCSNMEEILNGPTTYEDAQAELRHNICAGVCCRQYMTTLGCA
jgi:hypothetical protein